MVEAAKLSDEFFTNLAENKDEILKKIREKHPKEESEYER